MLAEPRLADVVLRVLPVTEEACAEPAGVTLPDPGDVRLTTEEAAASVAYCARKRQHADMEHGGPVHPGFADTRCPADASPDASAGPAASPALGSPIHKRGSQGPGWSEREAHAWGSADPGAGPRGGAASPSAARPAWDGYPEARDDGFGSAPDGRCAWERHDDYPETAGADFGDGWPADRSGGAVGARHDHGDRREGRVGRGADALDDLAWPAGSQDDGRSHADAGPDGPMWRTDGGQRRQSGSQAGRHWWSESRRDGAEYPADCVRTAAELQRDAHSGRHWDAEPKRDCVGYPTSGSGAAARSWSGTEGGRHWWSESRRDGGEYPADGVRTATGSPCSARWDAAPTNDGPAAALLELGIVGPVATPVPAQPDVSHDLRLSSLWEPSAPMTATAWRDSLTSGKVVALFWGDTAVNWAEVGPPNITAAPVEYAGVGLAGVVPQCPQSLRTRAKRFHSALRRVMRGAGRPVHVWEYRGRD